MKEGSEILYLSRDDVERVGLRMADVVEVVEAALREHGEGRVEMPPKPGIHTQPDAFIHAMPAYIPSLGGAGLKWIAGYPDNYKRQLPYISGLLILNAPETGLPLAVMDATWITAARTGAVSAISAKYLANPGSKSLAVLGCGVQGRTQLEALALVCAELAEVRAYDVRPAALDAYVREMRERHPKLTLVPAAGPREAVVGADLIVTAGPILKHPHPAIEAAWLRPGVLGLPIDFDSYWTVGALAAAEKFYVDDVQQFEYYRSDGYFTGVRTAQGGLGEVVAGKRPRRESETERIVAMNLGLALEDVATAVRVYERARSAGIGTILPL
jgi:ornithine cyclodeaminase/alanine dehydrogenase-like protein (mu-crystallin family)